MKKYLPVLFLLLVIAFTACQNEKKNETTSAAANKTEEATQRNLETVHVINKAFETGDFSKVRSLIADDGIDHAGPNGDIKGADSIVASMKQWSGMATDMTSSTIKELADKEYVFQWMKVSGKMKTDGYGMKAGDNYNTEAIEVTRFNEAGKATEHWEFMTMAEMMKMMGGNPPAGK